MSSITFAKEQFTAAVIRGIGQCVVIGAQSGLERAFASLSRENVRLFAVDEEESLGLAANFVPTQFDIESLAAALSHSDFDRLKASLFVWVGGIGYRSANAALATLSFIASLPRGSGVVFDYTAVRTEPSVRSALDGLASCISVAGATVKHLIQPQALAALLGSLGFRTVTDVAQEETDACGSRFVSAFV